MKAVVTGTPLSARYVQALEQLGLSLLNGSKEILIKLGVPEDAADRELSEEEATRALKDAAIYIYGGLEPASAAVLEGAQDLRLITFLGTGWNDPGCVDADAAGSRRILVTNTAHANAASVAEAAVGLMLCLERGFFSMNTATKDGQWLPFRRRDLAGKTLGIIGLGAIGSRVARHATAGFGMQVSYAGPHRKPEAEAELGVKFATIPELFETCEFISVHAPAHAQNLITDEHLRSAKTDLVLINLSAPELVEPQGLIAALTEKRVRVAMDGMYKDDSIRETLLSFDDDRVIVLPRAAWLTNDSYNRMSDMALASITDFVNGKTEIRSRVL
jgi:lactate dehydrogenase-like 2-hydroxyacid dehydrogenase